MASMIIMAICLAILVVFVVNMAIWIEKTFKYLDKKIDMLDEAVYQYMKDEHNARVESDE